MKINMIISVIISAIIAVIVGIAVLYILFPNWITAIINECDSFDFSGCNIEKEVIEGEYATTFVEYKCDGDGLCSTSSWTKYKEKDETYPYYITKVFFEGNEDYLLLFYNDSDIGYGFEGMGYVDYGREIKLCYVDNETYEKKECTKSYKIIPSDDCLYFDLDMNLINRECMDGIHSREDYLK